jgi:hypothetical protein
MQKLQEYVHAHGNVYFQLRQALRGQRGHAGTAMKAAGHPDRGEPIFNVIKL